jgi:two-component system, OmpR family, sensor kinase
MSGVEFVPDHDIGPDTAPTTPPLQPATRPAREPAPEQAKPRRALGLRSLTARLVLGVVVLVAVLVTAIGTSTYFALRSFLYDRLDQQLAPIATGNQAHLDECIARGIDQCSIGGGPGSYRAPQTEWIVVLDSSGQTRGNLNANYAVRMLSLDAAMRRTLVEHPDKSTTVTTTDGEQLRVRAQPLSAPNDDIVVVSGLSTDGVTKTLGRLLAVELIIGLSAVLVAFVATSYGVRLSLRNLRRVTTTANEVAAELSPTGAGLDRRVDVPDDGTEVGQLAESMNTLLSAVETQFAARLHSEHRLRQFIADASHELRTPLTSIRGYAELARMQRAVGADAEDNLARIESEGTRMSRLVDDLLTLARGEQSSPPRLELIDVGELLEDAVNSARAAFPNRAIDLEVAAGLHVVGDRDQLYRVVRNLIGNADMHTAAGRPVLVRCAADRPEAVVQVVDGGPGLPPEEAAHVFERFWRADKARSRARGGTGLGLSIVASVVAGHGGTVRFDSSVEGGSTVTVRLPAVDA